MKTLTAVIFAIAIVLAAIFLGNAYVDRATPQGTISVTGLGETDFSSDLIVWNASFNVQNANLRDGYAKLNQDKETVRNYLKQKGVKESEIVFASVSVGEVTEPRYSPSGEYQGTRFLAHRLTQSVEVNSNDVDRVEEISRNITELLNSGLTIYSQAPRYYYTGLADLKVQMISKATEDARIRAEQIAENSGGDLGNLRNARMGVFQITGQNSAEDYSWGGTYNTASREKTASITVKLDYTTD